MQDIIAKALTDKTEVPDYSTKRIPMSTYSANLNRLYELVKKDKVNGINQEIILKLITGSLREPYKTPAKIGIDLFKAAGGTSSDIIDGLIKAYDEAKENFE